MTLGRVLTNRQVHDAITYNQAAFRGAYVRTVRAQLGLPEDGAIDEAFVRVVADWQEANLGAGQGDGRIGPNTEGALNILLPAAQRAADAAIKMFRPKRWMYTGAVLGAVVGGIGMPLLATLDGTEGRAFVFGLGGGILGAIMGVLWPFCGGQGHCGGGGGNRSTGGLLAFVAMLALVGFVIGVATGQDISRRSEKLTVRAAFAEASQANWTYPKMTEKQRQAVDYLACLVFGTLGGVMLGGFFGAKSGELASETMEVWRG